VADGSELAELPDPLCEDVLAELPDVPAPPPALLESELPDELPPWLLAPLPVDDPLPPLELLDPAPELPLELPLLGAVGSPGAVPEVVLITAWVTEELVPG